MNSKKKGVILILVIIAIILLIFGILKLKTNGKVSEKEIRCIAENSRLYVSKTCSACASQKKLLGNYTFYFNITDCIDNQEECMNNGITRIPTWIINKEKYTELHTFEELKELTGC